MATETQPVDLFPWTREMEIEYELWAIEQDEKRYNEIMAAIDADGGDISHEMYQDPYYGNPIDTTKLEPTESYP